MGTSRQRCEWAWGGEGGERGGTFEARLDCPTRLLGFEQQREGQERKDTNARPPAVAKLGQAPNPMSLCPALTHSAIFSFLSQWLQKFPQDFSGAPELAIVRWLLDYAGPPVLPEPGPVQPPALVSEDTQSLVDLESELLFLSNVVHLGAPDPVYSLPKVDI
ncbi:ras guanine nucleotide exchange factor [Echinococcus multilocularis]|uniref:Ras guanine nucleotide exchange factor n=1 Tax=Echinococcus multilocularis TaxID=6211 RepID=A0A068XX56_ECHMU|nr:ras guanine nucleotide exchange factor [Echinococcus multilocularis]